MASPDGQGYLIPENPTPEEMACILVFYPNDPFYLRALLGALSYFGTWTAWERDASKRGRLAAAAWKEANECTYDSMGCLTELVAALGSINTTLAAIQAAIENQEISLDPADLVTAINGVQLAIENQEIALDTGLLLPALTGIQTAIENQEIVCNCAAGGSDDMGTVNVYCGCGCSSGAGTGSDLDDGTAPGGTPIDDAMPPVDQTDDYDDGENYEYSQEDACALVHWVLLFWRNTLLGVASGELATTGVWAVVDGMFSGIFGYTIPKPKVVDEILLWFGRLSGSSTLAAEIDRTYEAIQCRLLQRDIYRDKYADVCAIVDTWATNALTKLYAKRFIDILPFRWIYSSNVVGSTIANGIIPSWAYTRGCPSCIDTTPEDPQLGHLFPPDGLKWIPVNPSGHFLFGSVLTYEGDGVFVRFAGSTEQWQVKFHADFGTGGTLPQNVRAYAVEVLSHEFTAYYQTSGHRLLPDGDYIFDVNKGLIANVLGAPIEVPTGWEMHAITGSALTTYWRVYTGTLRYRMMVLVSDTYPYDEWIGS